MVKNLPTMQETWIGSLGWEYPLEKEMTTYSSILAWKIPRTEELGRFKSTGSRRVRHDRATNTFTFDLSGGSVAKTRCFHCRDTSSSPIPHTAQCGQKKNTDYLAPSQIFRMKSSWCGTREVASISTQVIPMYIKLRLGNHC